MNDEVFRVAVAERLQSLGMTRYALAKATNGEVSTDTVYRWMAGKTSITATSLGLILGILGWQGIAWSDLPKDGKNNS